MAKFFVGQRVRIKYSTGWPELAGEEATISDAGKVNVGVNKGKNGWEVAPDCWGSSKAPYQSRNGALFLCALDQQLEPSTDSYDKIEWSECLWQPEHLREKA